jgi:hypothetical protein
MKTAVADEPPREVWARAARQRVHQLPEGAAGVQPFVDLVLKIEAELPRPAAAGSEGPLALVWPEIDAKIAALQDACDIDIRRVLVDLHELKMASDVPLAERHARLASLKRRVEPWRRLYDYLELKEVRFEVRCRLDAAVVELAATRVRILADARRR